jgi:ABC-type multidrug transport system permease subunit
VNFLFDSMVKDLRWRFADPTALILAVCIPVLIGGLMSLVMGGSDGPIPRASLLVVDQDESLLSRFIDAAGSGGQGGDFLDVERVDLQEGQERMNRGEASAMLIIPEGFGKAMLEEKPTTLRLVKNPSQTILPNMVEEGLLMLVEGSFYVHRIFGEPIKAIAAGPEEGNNFFADLRMAALIVQINQRMRALEDILFPPVLELETEIVRPAGESERPQGSFGALFLPGILLMALMFLSAGMSEDLWHEKEKGTLRRMVSTPQAMSAFLGGKLLAGCVLMTGIGLAGLLVGVLSYGMSWSAIPLATLWLGFSGGTLLCYFLLIQTLASSQRGGSILTSMLLFPLMMIGGAFFPFEIMPQWMQDIGAVTPTGLSIIQLKSILSGSWQAESLFIDLASIGIPGLVAFLLTTSRLRGVFLLK